MKQVMRVFLVVLGIVACLLIMSMISVDNRNLDDTLKSNSNVKHILYGRHILSGKPVPFTVNPNVNQSTKVDVMVFGYARGGSTYVGQMLGYNDDTFYFYEPLYVEEDPLRYFRNDTICEMNGSKCRPIDRQQVSKAVAKIDALYKCDPMIFPQFIWKWQREIGGKPWKYNNLTEICARSKYRVSKVLRISAELVEELLIKNTKLKVLYLYRDPRGIINSRFRLRKNERWNRTMRNTEDVAKGVCHKIEKDTEVFFKLKQKREYQNRIYFIDYEGIAKNPVETSHNIFDVLGVDVSNRYMTVVSNLGKQPKKADRKWNSALRSDGYAASIKWRTEMTQNDKNDIDKHCDKVYKKLGYDL